MKLVGLSLIGMGGWFLIGSWKGTSFLVKSFKKSGVDLDLPKEGRSWQKTLGEWQTRILMASVGLMFIYEGISLLI